MSDFDVLVIGAGAGGGIAAYEFAKQGKRVLVVDRGKRYPAGWTGRDQLRNHRNSAYGHNTGPDLEGNPRVFVRPDGSELLVNPIQGGYNNNAMAVGGGTVVYGAQAWRFHPLDFRMATTYGVPGGSALSDWPIDYDALAPYYESIEHELGVCGGKPATNMPERADYPMEALPISDRGSKLRETADHLGWANQPVPLLINSVPRNGRGACIRCQHCVGFGCPTDAKAGTQNTVLPKMLEYEGCELWSATRVLALTTDSAGKITGARLTHEELSNPSDPPTEVTADLVVLAAGAIETARLLLGSCNSREPDGIGNGAGWVGRCLQGHYYPGAQALFDWPITDMLGPGPSVSVTQFNHGNPGVVGGGMLADDFLTLPAQFARDRRKPGVPGHGIALKEWMREGYRHTCHIFGPVQDIPNPACRVTLDRDVIDSHGIPVAKLSGTTHPETARTALFMREKAVEWLTASGAKEVWKFQVGLGMSGGQHQAGTCRMAKDPSLGVVDSQGRVFGHDNLIICDGSVHVTNGGFNPVLTIMATARRTASLFEW